LDKISEDEARPILTILEHHLGKQAGLNVRSLRDFGTTLQVRWDLTGPEIWRPDAGKKVKSGLDIDLLVIANVERRFNARTVDLAIAALAPDNTCKQIEQALGLVLPPPSVVPPEQVMAAVADTFVRDHPRAEHVVVSVARDGTLVGEPPLEESLARQLEDQLAVSLARAAGSRDSLKDYAPMDIRLERRLAETPPNAAAWRAQIKLFGTAQGHDLTVTFARDSYTPVSRRAAVVLTDIIAPPPPPPPAEWVKLADYSALKSKWDSDAVSLGAGAGAFRFLKLTARNNTLLIKSLVVTFADGQLKTISVPARLDAGSSTPELEVNGEGRPISKIAIRHRTVPGISGYGRMEIWGLR
jgi:hypothetical protein